MMSQIANVSFGIRRSLTFSLAMIYCFIFWQCIISARGQVISCRRRRFWSVFKQLSTLSFRKKRFTRRKFTKVSKQRHMHDGAVNICVNITNCFRLWIYLLHFCTSYVHCSRIFSQLRASYLNKLLAYPWPSEISFFWQLPNILYCEHTRAPVSIYTRLKCQPLTAQM